MQCDTLHMRYYSFTFLNKMTLSLARMTSCLSLWFFYYSNVKTQKYLFNKKELVLIMSTNEQKNNRETASVIQAQG